ncbi:hypothetical protein EVAR_84118_1 [Eumeta japonica]|uniref:Secreted protein n=1 Tax=Eumeta variegata TaxID=151549 RepID=A0A4C1V0E4_EUMVA|nr:hypothetical protein EVAR_84118_1 [Eumeta japonica]
MRKTLTTLVWLSAYDVVTTEETATVSELNGDGEPNREPGPALKLRTGLGSKLSVGSGLESRTVSESESKMRTRFVISSKNGTVIRTENRTRIGIMEDTASSVDIEDVEIHITVTRAKATN